MVDKKKIRMIYSELQGYLAKAPTGDHITSAMWTQVNNAVEELNSVSNGDYSRFMMVPRRNQTQGGRTREYLASQTYESNLAGLIGKLHAEYFSDDPPPFSGMPSTVITQTQQQSQSQTQMLIDFTSKIDEEINKLEPGGTKRSFLEKVRGALGSVKDYAGLIALYVTTAKEFGLTLEELTGLFK